MPPADNRANDKQPAHETFVVFILRRRKFGFLSYEKQLGSKLRKLLYISQASCITGTYRQSGICKIACPKGGLVNCFKKEEIDYLAHFKCNAYRQPTSKETGMKHYFTEYPYNTIFVFELQIL